MDKDDSKPSAPRTLCLINEDEEDEEGDEEEDIPEDLQDLSPEQQQVAAVVVAETSQYWSFLLSSAVFAFVFLGSCFL